MNEDINWEEVCKGCGECCGIMTFSPEFIVRHNDKIQRKYEPKHVGHKRIFPETDDYLCIFLNRETKRCMIYNERQKVCKKYGTVPELPCPKVDPVLWKEWDKKINNKLQELNRLRS